MYIYILYILYCIYTFSLLIMYDKKTKTSCGNGG